MFMSLSFGAFLPPNPLPPPEPKLTSVNEFISNVSIFAPNRDTAFYYRKKMAVFAFWYSKRSHVVNIQVKSNFEMDNQEQLLSVHGGDTKATYYEKGKQLQELNIDKIELLKGLFDEAKHLASTTRNGESSEGGKSSGIRSSMEMFEYHRYNELSKTFFPPKEEMLLQLYREEFSRLSPEEKENLRRKVNHGLTSKETQSSIYQKSIELFGTFKENLIFPVGQTSAWFAAMAQIHQPNAQRFCHVAFNGCWYELEKCINTTNPSVEQDLKLKYVEAKLPTFDQVKFYRSYLSRIGCSPQRILGQKEPSVIVEYVHRAGEVKSFLEHLFSWAINEGISTNHLRNKLMIMCLHDKSLSSTAPGNDLIKYLQLNLGEYSMYAIIAMPIEQNDFPMQNYNKNLISPSENIIEEEQSLVKFFPPKEWTEVNCKKSSFSHDEAHKHIFPIYASFMETVEQMKAVKK